MARSFESDANNYDLRGIYDSESFGSRVENTIPSFTHLGRKGVPITSSCQELLDAIVRVRWDIPFTAELIRRSSVYFSDYQLALVQNLLDSAEVERRFGYLQQFLDDLVDFEESITARIEEEKVFFTNQKRRYVEVYEILRQHSFPYSANQGECLHRMIKALYVVTGHPNSEADKEFVSGLWELVRLLQLDDHIKDETPHRFIVNNTIHYHMHRMVKQLDRLAKEEEGRPHPDFIHPNSEIDLATYLVANMRELVDETKILTQRDHFHNGMVEIYTRFVEIFRKSGLDFSRIQEEVLCQIESLVRDLKESPRMSKHHGIGEACLEFITELEENNPDREVTLEGDTVVWAEEGKNNKAIRKISWDLIYLQPITAEHLSNFICFGNGIINVIPLITERFLTLYPMR